MTNKRHFYRCQDCLTVVASETKIGSSRTGNALVYGVCDACEGFISEYMGATMGCILVKTGYECPCDGRCTGAVGPSCDCSCGGENHGKNVVVEVVKEANKLPRFMTPKDAGKKAVEFRALVADVQQAWKTRFDWVISRKLKGEYLQSGDWNTYTQAVQVKNNIAKAKKLQVHGTRVKKLTALLSQLRGNSVIAA